MSASLTLRLVILRTYRAVYMDVLNVVGIVQKVYRGSMGRRVSGRRRKSVLDIQRMFRGCVVRRIAKDLNRRATIVQAAERGRRSRLAFALIRDLIVAAQAAIRGWAKRRIAGMQRRERLDEYKDVLFECWRRCYTPLAYRSRFWGMFDGGGFLDVAVHEDELCRVWKDLGVWREETGGKGIMRQISTLSDSGSSGKTGLGVAEGVRLEVGEGTCFYKKFKHVQEILRGREVKIGLGKGKGGGEGGGGDGAEFFRA